MDGGITIPNNWAARPHQRGFMKAMLVDGVKRACEIWHRRAGKDSASINFTAIQTQQKVATYWHMLPTAIQARHVVWDAINPDTGIRIIDQAFPKEIRKATNETEMQIELKNGSIWQCVGSDNYDRLVGANPFGVIFSEYSLADPAAWDYIRPMLKENGGWAIFIFTFRGKNHGYKLYEMAKKNPKWHCELLDIEHTFRDDAKTIPIITQEDYQEELDDGMDALLALQEYYCSPDAGMMGAYFTKQLSLAKVGDYPWNPIKPVHTFWDIGLDWTAIWFLQESDDGDGINVIDYWGATNTDLPAWAKRIHEAPYWYGSHVGPHDIKRRSWLNAEMSYKKMAEKLGIDFEECPLLPKDQQINAAQAFLPRCRFNRDTTTAGYEGLTNYRREYNTKLNVFMNRPIHDYASHPADAFEVAAIAWPENFGANDFNFTVKHAIGGKTITSSQSDMQKMMKHMGPVNG